MMKAILNKLLAPVLDQLDALKATVSKELNELKEDTRTGLFTEIDGKLYGLDEKLRSVASDVEDIDLKDIDFSSIESAVEAAVENACNTSDLEYSIERCQEEARDASSIAGENRISLEELLKLFKDVWPEGAGAKDEPEAEPEPEQPEHDALQQFAAGEYPVVQLRIVGRKLLICDQSQVLGEHYLPDTTGDMMKGFIVRILAPICDELAADRPWMAAYNTSKATAAVRA